MDMSEDKKRKMNQCYETKVVQTHRVFANHLNQHKTLFGGQLMSYIDDAASISAVRHCRGAVMTASMDSLNFLHPIYEDHSVCLESYVSGAGTTSMEVFTKVTGEELLTGKRYLAATCFTTFVSVAGKDEKKASVPSIEPITEEEVFICKGYEERKERRLVNREFNEDFSSQVSYTPPWIASKN